MGCRLDTLFQWGMIHDSILAGYWDPRASAPSTLPLYAVQGLVKIIAAASQPQSILTDGNPPILPPANTLSALLPSASHGGGNNIAVYWGQDGREGTLADACLTGLYSYVMIAFLNVFGANQTPLPQPRCPLQHFLPWQLRRDRRPRQNLPDHARQSLPRPRGRRWQLLPLILRRRAGYLWNNFLGRSSSSRPFGDAAVLDGIDLAIVTGKPDHYDDLARRLNWHFSRSRSSTYYLSAAAQCPYPDRLLAPALNTGLFRFAWVQFYNNPQCEYSKSIGTVYLGLPAAPQAAGSGYVLPADLVERVLPMVQNASRYGGIMLWSRYYDVINNYSINVTKYVDTQFGSSAE